MLTTGFISGFTPAHGSTPGTAASGGEPAAAGSLFAALLGLVGGSVPEGEASLFSGEPGTPAAGTDVAALFGGEAALPAPEGMPRDAVPLLGDLIDALTALSDAIATGNAPVAPSLEADVMQKLEAFAEAIGLTLPAMPGPEVTIAALAQGEGPADPLDPLAAIETSANVGAAPTAPGAPTPGPQPSSPLAATATVGAAPVGDDPPTPPGALPPTASIGDPVPDEPAAEPKPLPPIVAQLIEKIGEIATAVEPKAPGLAKRLEALAERLGSGDIDAEAFAKLGIPVSDELPETELAAAIGRLLAAGREVKGAAAPRAFASPSLALPDMIVLPPAERPAAGTPLRPEPAGTAKAGPDAKPDREPPPAQEARAVDRGTRADAEPPRRSDAGPAVQANAAAAEGQGAPAQPGQGAVHAAVATAAADARAAHAAYAAPARQINLPQVAFEIARHVQAGASRFQIRLDPPELGRIDVKLDVDAAGNVNARMTVERSETLDLMQRDQRSLERALAQAGLDSSKTNLEFSLRQNPFGHEERNQQRQDRGALAALAGADDPAIPAQAAASHLAAYRGTASPGGLNLFV